MKKIIPIILLSAALAGCSIGEVSPETHENSKVKHESSSSVKKENNKAKSLTDIYIPNPQVSDDTRLLQTGSSLKDDKGEVTLKGIAALNKTYNIGPIEMKIKNVKLIHNLPTYSLMDYFHYYTENYEEFDYIKVEVELVNESDKTVHFGPVAHLRTNNGEIKDFKDDFYIEYLGGEIESKGTKQGALGFILEKSTPNVNSVEITTSDALDINHKEVGKAQNIRIDLK